jgi:predicted RND superfamily exporter protein
MSYVHAHTATETLQQIDKMIDNVILELKTKPVDPEFFKKVYQTEYDITSVEDIETVISFNMAELFVTAHDIKCKVRVPGRKYRRSVRALLMFYVLATSKDITLDAIGRIIAEIDDSRFKRNVHNFWIATDEWRRIFINKALMNEHLTEDVRLWLELQ